MPDGCGFTLQNRGSNFSLIKGHANCAKGGKRPYHTIIPALITKKGGNGDGEFYATMTNMGGFMQPQGHVQLLSNLVDYGMDAQEAVDAPRFCLDPFSGGEEHEGRKRRGEIKFEVGTDPAVISELEKRGHAVSKGPLVDGSARALFGRAQIIRVLPNTAGAVIEAGSDCRGDGCAMATNYKY